MYARQLYIRSRFSLRCKQLMTPSRAETGQESAASQQDLGHTAATEVERQPDGICGASVILVAGHPEGHLVLHGRAHLQTCQCQLTQTTTMTMLAMILLPSMCHPMHYAKREKKTQFSVALLYKACHRHVRRHIGC